MKLLTALISLFIFGFSLFGNITQYHSVVARKKAAVGGTEFSFISDGGGEITSISKGVDITF